MIPEKTMTRAEQLIQYYRAKPRTPPIKAAEETGIPLNNVRSIIYRIRSHHRDIFPVQHKGTNRTKVIVGRRNQQRVHDMLIAKPGIRIKEIAYLLDLTPDTVAKHVTAIRRTWRT